jgi:hypothetical protein
MEAGIMDSARFVRRENIKHFCWLLERTADESERKRVHKLLAEEQLKQIAAGDRLDGDLQKAG